MWFSFWSGIVQDSPEPGPPVLYDGLGGVKLALNMGLPTVRRVSAFTFHEWGTVFEEYTSTNLPTREESDMF